MIFLVYFDNGTFLPGIHDSVHFVYNLDNDANCTLRDIQILSVEIKTFFLKLV